MMMLVLAEGARGDDEDDDEWDVQPLYALFHLSGNCLVATVALAPRMEGICDGVPVVLGREHVVLRGRDRDLQEPAQVLENVADGHVCADAWADVELPGQMRVDQPWGGVVGPAEEGREESVNVGEGVDGGE
ncbi:hypothetical protein ID866_7915 [Astraeus odoratus]|nr:hypothetical protein ID866_7915 [Astraeus odoratus]